MLKQVQHDRGKYNSSPEGEARWGASRKGKSNCHSEHLLCHPELVSGSKKQMLKHITATPTDTSSHKNFKILNQVQNDKIFGSFCKVQHDKNKKVAFTLAEVLITIGVIGVVAAISLPTLLTNVQERVRKEQVRTAKYKLTTSTSKMNADGQMIPYENTHEFIKVLSGHYKIISECDNNHLENCWPAKVINIPKPDGTFETKNVSTIKTGADLQAIALGTKQTETRGIISGDGISMILVFSPKCAPMEDGASQSWSTVDGKPETNATTNCISAIFDINGGSGPNRLGVDIRTLNSLYGARNLGSSYQALSYNDCMAHKKKLGIKECRAAGSDRFAGAMKACKDMGLNLPSMQTLANAAGSMFGVSDLGTYENINCQNCGSGYTGNRTLSRDNDSSLSLSGAFWSSSEISSTDAWKRSIGSSSSFVTRNDRYFSNDACCVGD